MADEVTIESLQAELAGRQAELAGARARLTEVNNESKGHRLNYENEKRRAETIGADMERVTKDFGDRLTVAEAARAEAHKVAQAARKDAALRLAAKDAGMVDLDGLRLLDSDLVTVADDGAVTIPDKYFANAKAAKPWLFGAPSTSSTAAAPGNTEAKPKQAGDMTADEYRTARTALLRR